MRLNSGRASIAQSGVNPDIRVKPSAANCSASRRSYATDAAAVDLEKDDALGPVLLVRHFN
jgi:hypothetical protein